MDIKLIFGIASAIVAVVSFVPYIVDIIKRETQPHAYSWLIWAIIQAIGVTAQFKNGAGYGSWALLIEMLYCFSIFLLSFKYGTKNITRFDTICLVLSLGAIMIFLSLKNPMWAVILITFIDIIGFLPTFRKGYKEPFTETTSTFALCMVANVLSLLALQAYSVTTVLYVASMFFTNFIFVIFFLLRRKILRLRSI